MIILIALTYNHHVSQAYKFSAAELQLLSKTSVDKSKITYKDGKLSYNRDSESKVGGQSITVSSATNSTGKNPYKVTLPAMASDGIEFSDSTNDLPFKVIPASVTGQGRYINNRMVYRVAGGKGVYTLRRNGIKEDIILTKAPGDTATYKWKLELGDKLEAKMLHNGSVGIYSADPLLNNSSLQVSDAKSQSLIDNARKNGKKTYLQYLIPRPYFKDGQGKLSAKGVSFNLSGDVLTLTATGLKGKKYPLSIDPTIVTTTTADFRTGYDDGNIDYGTADEIKRGNISLGTVGSWNYTYNSNSCAFFSSPCTSGFNTARQRTSVVAYNGYLYVIGGLGDPSSNDCNASGLCNGVQFAQINSNGTIGSWNYTGSSSSCSTWTSPCTTSFVANRYSHASVAYNGYLYILGGSGTANTGDCDASQQCKGVQFAQINSNGTIGTWNYTYNNNSCSSFVSPCNGGFNNGRFGLTSVAYNGYLYVIGGSNNTSTNDCNGQFCNGVQFAPINANGTIGTWNYTSNSTNNGSSFVAGFTTGRYWHASIAYNGYLYVIGGSGSGNDCNGGQACNGTQFAPINSNGTIGAWNYTYNGNSCSTWTSPCSTGFTQARYLHTSVAYNGYLYVIGGSANGSFTQDCPTSLTGTCSGIQLASINANGTIGTWSYTHNSTNDGGTFVAGFNTSRGGHSSVVYNGYIYVLGGASGSTSVSRDCNAGGRCNGVQFVPIDSGTPTFGTDGTWNYTSNSTNNGATFSAGFSTARYDHASLAYNGYLYLLGGYDGSSIASGDCDTNSYCNGVQFAPINSDGTIGAWRFTHNSTDDGTSFVAGFISPRSGHTAQAYNGYMYVIGGEGENGLNDCNNTAGFFCNGVEFAPINADGTVGAWHYTHNSTDDGTTFVDGFIGARNQHTSVVYNGYLYIIGGEQGNASECASGLCNGVQFAPINANGTVGSWHYTHNSIDDGTSFVAGFMGPRLGHTTVAYNGYLYIVGGQSAASTNDCNSFGLCNGVQFAPINANGTIGSWNYTYNGNSCSSWTAPCSTGFKTNRLEQSSVVYNGYLYVIGGQSANVGSDDCISSGGFIVCNGVQYSPINANGTIGTWAFTHNSANDGGTFSAGFTNARYGHSSVAYNGFVYIIGGHGVGSTECPSAYCNGVQYTTVNSPGQTATYEKLVDIGGNNLIKSISFNGRAVCGDAISYKVGSAAGTFGATTKLPFVLPAATYNINQSGRYLWFQFKLNDSSCGTQSQITDITVTYNIAPAAPTLSTPSAGATGVSALPQFQLRTTDADNDYLQYKIEICSASDCSSVFRTVDQTSSQTGWTGQDQQVGTAYTGNSVITSSTMASHTYQPAVLSKNTQYWWRAYAIDPGGSNTWSSASAIQTFTTGDDVPSAPTLLYPVNSSNGNSIFTTFQLSSSENNGDYLRYWIDVCADNTCSSIIRSICQTNTGTGVPGTCTSSQTGWASQDQQSGTAYSGSPTITSSTLASHSYQSPYLTKNTTYWWRAYAIDPGGSNTWSSASAIQSFTTALTETHIQGNLRIQGNVKL